MRYSVTRSRLIGDNSLRFIPKQPEESGFGKQAAQILASGASDVTQRQGASEDLKDAAKPTRSSSRSFRLFRYTPAIRCIQSIESTWKGHELFGIWIVQKIKPKVTVDLGFDMGLSTFAFAHRNRGHTFGVDWIGNANFSRKRAAMESAFQNISAAIRLKYVKNIHLFIGPLNEIAQKWDCKIDLLHIDGMHSYEEIKEQYEHWKLFLNEDAVILIHDVEGYPEETGRFFRELSLPKLKFTHNNGLGIATKSRAVCEAISEEWTLNQYF